MSWDPMPEWTSSKSIVTEQVKCPYCGADNQKRVKELIDECWQVNTYWAAHVPPYVEVTCLECEEDFNVTLRLVVYVVSVQKG